MNYSAPDFLKIDVNVNESFAAYCNYVVKYGYETLLTADFARKDTHAKSLVDSVISSHLLFDNMRTGDRDVDKGGFTADGINAPVRNGETVPAYLYSEEITEGFAYAYQFAMARRPLFAGLIHLFDSCKFRVLMRPTRVYAQISALLEKLPSELREQSARLLLENAYKKDIDPDRLQKVKKVLEAEIDAVLKNEIPLFYVPANAHELWNCNECVQADCFLRSPIEKSLSVLEKLSPQDCTVQQKIIVQALSADRPADKYIAVPSETDNAFRTVFNKLENAALDGQAMPWMRLERAKDGNLFLVNSGFGLYGGTLGTLCCYAALYRKTGSKQILDALLYRYETYREYALTSSLRFSERNISLQDGLGGHINALCHIAALTENRMFFGDAVSLLDALVLPSEPIEGTCDILNGFAGLAIALPRIGNEKAEKTAAVLAKPLTSYIPQLTGTGHGTAGIALALGALGSVLKTDAYNARILQLLEWENQNFNKEKNNWYDLRKAEKGQFMYGWCSGAPGIGMARKKLSDYTNDPQIRTVCEKDIQCALALLAEQKYIARDSLCCGHASMLAAASYLGAEAPALYDRLQNNVLSDTVELFHPAGTCDMNPGLMQGIAGIGYTLALYGDPQCGAMLV